MSGLTVTILVIVLWCAVAVLLGLLLGGVLRAVSHDDTRAGRVQDETLREPSIHDDALSRDKAHPSHEPESYTASSRERKGLRKA